MQLPDFLTVWPANEIMTKGHRISLYHVIKNSVSEGDEPRSTARVVSDSGA